MSSGRSILVADDDLRMRELLAEIVAGAGQGVTLAADGAEALKLLAENEFDLVLTDLKMPGAGGIDVLDAAKIQDADRPVILVTAHGTVPAAMAAVRRGAYDFIEKPFEPEVLLLAVERALAHYHLVRRHRELDRTLVELKASELVGSGNAMQRLKGFVAKIAPLDVPVLIQGETGTGKELVARLIHRHSSRAKGRFLPVNCGALPDALLESELFGHEKGAFTGAGQTKKGLVELADGGTLFLDEVQAMPITFQVKLLRFLQDHTFMRVGGVEERSADLRVVAAANADLRQEVAAGRFREDLFYRLNMITVSLPSLHERLEDVPELAYFFLARAARLFEKEVRGISDQVLMQLLTYNWPGNVRELENCIGRAVIMSEGDTLEAVSLPESAAGRHDDSIPASIRPLREMEQEMIRRALAATGNNRAAAARLLGIDVTTLWRKMKRA
jgi:DNA-binding NtrC family response regulator